MNKEKLIQQREKLRTIHLKIKDKEEKKHIKVIDGINAEIQDLIARKNRLNNEFCDWEINKINSFIKIDDKISKEIKEASE